MTTREKKIRKRTTITVVIAKFLPTRTNKRAPIYPIRRTKKTEEENNANFIIQLHFDKKIIYIYTRKRIFGGNKY